MIRTLSFAAAVLAAPMAFADSDEAAPSGDPQAGEAAFRQCIACHVVRDPEGNVLAGRNGRTGPNLYGISGRPAASVEDFRYGPGILEAAEAGLVWNEETFSEYVPNATEFLREYTGNSRLRSAMSPQRVDEEDVANLWAFIVSLGPDEMEDDEMEDDEMEEDASE